MTFRSSPQHNSLCLIMLLLTICLFDLTAMAQNPINADELFQQARKLAFSNQREEASKICAQILEQYPNYHDARILLGRLSAWKEDYSSAREELTRVALDSPENLDALTALSDVELWSDNFEQAVIVCNQGLKLSPENEQLLFRKARALNSLGDRRTAITMLKQILAIHPEFTQAAEYLKTTEFTAPKYRVSLNYGYEAFDKTFSPWNTSSLALTRRTDALTLIGRLNYAHRFGTDAVQYEVDLYPKIKKGTYAYLNFGYSNSNIFPKYRYGAEIFHNLGKGFEASLGVRHIRFESSDFTTTTASLGKYYGKYYFNVRSFITPDSTGTSFSTLGTVRRYFSDAETYISITAGVGSSTDQRITTPELFRLNSQRFSIELRKRIRPDFVTTIGFDFENQQIFSNQSRKRYGIRIGLESLF